MVANPMALPDGLTPGEGLDARTLRRLLIAGCRRVLAERDALNRINVFPVPDGDTGSNLGFTLSTVLDVSLRRPMARAGDLLGRVAADALDGARGNSGAILAQFFQGVAEASAGAEVLDRDTLVAAAQAGADQAREALAQPREGTILSVIQGFAQELRKQAAAGVQDLGELFERAYLRAQQALAATPDQLPVLRQAGVVDAGGQGFVDLLSGMRDLLRGEPLPRLLREKSRPSGDWDPHGHDADSEHRWCTECMVESAAVDRDAVRVALAQMDLSCLVVAGSRQRLRVHAHVDDPDLLFRTVEAYGSVSARKADDMHAQMRNARGHFDQVAVVTDSAGDLPEELAASLGIQVVPVRLSFGDRDYLDRVSLQPDEFYRMLRESPLIARTSQPPPGDFRRVFETLLAHHHQVISLQVSGRLSGTLQAAASAAQRSDPERVRVFDSLNAAGGQGLLTIAAAEAARAGLDAPAIQAYLEQLRPRTHTFALAEDLRYGVRGGRVPAWLPRVARWLRVMPVIGNNAAGQLKPRGLIFGRQRRVERFAAFLGRRLRRGESWRLLVGHADCAAEADQLAALLRPLLGTDPWLHVVSTGTAVGVHTGPGTLVVALQAYLQPKAELKP